MKISTKGRYSLRMLAYIASFQDKRNVSISDISSSQQISIKYLEQIARKLVKGGLIRSSRGKSGGYAFAKPPKDISIKDVLLLTEGDLFPVKCIKQDPNMCPQSENCFTLKLWKELYSKIDDYFSSKTLQDLIGKYKGEEMPFEAMYI